MQTDLPDNVRPLRRPARPHMRLDRRSGRLQGSRRIDEAASQPERIAVQIRRINALMRELREYSDSFDWMEEHGWH